MNKNAYLIAAILILALFTGGAFLLGRESGSSSSSSSSSSSGAVNVFEEFSAEITAEVESSGETYTIEVYSHISTDDAGDIKSWTLDSVVSWDDDQGSYRNVQTGERLYGQALDPETGEYGTLACRSVPHTSLVNVDVADYVPREVEDRGDGEDSSAWARPCPGCKLWRTVIMGTTVMLQTQNGLPVQLYAADIRFTVESFTPQARTFTPPAVAFEGRCQAPIDPPENDPPHHNGTEPSEDDAVSGELDGSACVSSWIGDGWCDSVNNNAACQFDGGDCCRGSCYGTRTYACGYRGFSCSAAQKQAAPPCSFMHGFNNEGPSTDPNAGTWTSYQRSENWGNMQSVLEGACGSFRFGFFDTIRNGWTNSALQERYYQEAKSTRNQGGCVFAHSMANNILAGACLRSPSNRCDISWIDAGGPIRGSKAASFAVNTWIGSTFGPIFGFSSSSPTDALATLREEGYGHKYASTANRAEELSRRVHFYDLTSHMMCGTSAWGSGGGDGITFQALDQVVWGLFNGANTDGVVAQDDCRRYGIWRTRSYREKCNWWCLFWCSYCTRTVSEWVLYDHGPGQSSKTNPTRVNYFSTSQSHTHTLVSGHHYDVALRNGDFGGNQISDWYRRAAANC